MRPCTGPLRLVILSGYIASSRESVGKVAAFALRALQSGSQQPYVALNFRQPFRLDKDCCLA